MRRPLTHSPHPSTPHPPTTRTPQKHHSASFKLAVEDCLDASFRVFLEDLYSSLYAASAAAAAAAAASASAASTAMPGASGSRMDKGEEGEEEEEEEGQETGQDSRPEVRASAFFASAECMYGLRRRWR